MSFCFITLILISTHCWGQSKRDYDAINLLIKLDTINNSHLLNNSSYLSKLHFNSNPFKPRQKKLLTSSFFIKKINRLINKNIASPTQEVDKSKIKKSFVKWDSKKIHFSRFIKKENNDFFYYTKPIFVSANNFISINYFHTGGGGISIVLYKIDDLNENVEILGSITQLSYGIRFR